MDGQPLILLVDDEPFNLDYLTQELEEQGIEISTAANGQEALAAVAQRPPDMIFLDIMMPVMDGFTVLQALRADDRWRDIPVVIVSAASDMRNVVRGIEMGADDFLPKPFDPVLLHARLNAGLEKKRLRDVEQRYLRSLEREMEIARQIQAGFLPQVLPQPRGWEIAAFFRPAREVAGDFYDVFGLEEGRLALLIGDVTDKGVGSAMFMALFRSLLRAAMMADLLSGPAACQHVGPAVPAPAVAERLTRAVTMVNNYICTVHESPLFATLFFAVLDTATGDLVYVNAGHDAPCLLTASGGRESLARSGPLAGAFGGAEYHAESAHLGPGDRLVLYSDGIPDAKSPTGEALGEDRWQQLLEQPLAAGEQPLPRLVEGIQAFVGDSAPFDDMTLLVVSRL